jgi:sugar lactone lactonase YvrE
MNRRARAHPLIAVLLLPLACHGASPTPATPAGKHTPSSPRETIADLEHAARVALDAGKLETYRADLLTLHDLLHGHPDVVTMLAGAEARLGHMDQALRWLRELADMGLAGAGVRDDPALASLHAVPAFGEILDHFARNDLPVSTATLAFKLPDEELVAEDLAFDAASRTFYVSAVRARKIIVIPEGGGPARNFVPSGQDGLLSVLGLGIDPGRRLLLATTAGLPQADQFDSKDATRTEVRVYALDTAALLRRATLGATASDRVEHALTDMTVAPSGDAYVSDAKGGRVYRLRAGGSTLEPLGEDGELLGPQTPALAPDGAHLFIPDYVRGIAVMDLASGRLHWLERAHPVALDGIDGLYFADDTTLLAVQNGTVPERIVRLHLDASRTLVESAEVLEQKSSWLGDPTHGIVVGDRFYFIAQSGWEHMNDDGSVKSGESPKGSIVLQVPVR